jgi:hypothetical protein
MDCASQPENPTTFCRVIDRMLDEFETEVRKHGDQRRMLAAFAGRLQTKTDRSFAGWSRAF